MKISNSTNHFLDTNVVLRHANDDSGGASEDIQRILDDAANRKRQLWVSVVLFSELRPSSFAPGKFKSVDDLARYIRSIATVVAPTPAMALRAARLRDIRWFRPDSIRMPNEKPRTISLGDALHLVSALWVKEALDVQDVEFLTFDDGRSKTSEVEDGTKPLSILRIEEYSDGHGGHPDVGAVLNLSRVLPHLRQMPLALTPANPLEAKEGHQPTA